jgi:hypothetical protein
MQTIPVQTILNKAVDNTLGQLIYVVRDAELPFYVGQSKRNVVARFFEHLQKPTRLGQLIELNKPTSLSWQVDFYDLADCRPFVMQKSLFAMQAWEAFDMDMAEQALIRELRPVLNRDFNANPRPLPPTYLGQQLAATPQTDIQAPENRVWLNRMSLQGWTYEWDSHGRLSWHHRHGRDLSDQEVAPYRAKNQIPQG